MAANHLYGRNGPRMCWPSDCTDSSLAACSMGAQLLYDRVRRQVDDQGRMLGSPNVVASACFPLLRTRPSTVARWLEELSVHGLLIRYDAAGLSLLQFTRWHREQAGLRRTYPSQWPAPSGWKDTRKGLDESETARAEPNGEWKGRRTETNGVGSSPALRPQLAGAGRSPAACLVPVGEAMRLARASLEQQGVLIAGGANASGVNGGALPSESDRAAAGAPAEIAPSSTLNQGDLNA